MQAKSWIFRNLLALQQWWNSWTLKDVFSILGEYAEKAVELVKAPFKALAKWVSDLNPFSGWTAPKVDIATGKEWLLVGSADMSPSYMKPHALGGIFSQPHMGLIAEAGREAVIPLENKARGIPLWKAAGEEMGLLFGNTTNNNDNRTSSTVFSPSYTITINGGDQNTEQRFRQIIEETFRDIMAQAERLSFA
ncbi:MAG: hypothetical protein IJS39_06945 [Synergistaceae bacterium]|nr:hypothetical protein [Synergistaceae bacterium]